MPVGVLIRKTARIAVPIVRRQLATKRNEPSGRNFSGSNLRQRSQVSAPSGRGFSGSNLRRNPLPPRQKLPGHGIAPFKRGGRSYAPLPSRPTLPNPPQPPTPLRKYVDISRRINDKLTKVNRGLNDIAFPGLNEVSDFLNDQIIRFIKEQRRYWRRVRNILDEARKNPKTPTPNPESNLTVPIDPRWKDTDSITVRYGATSFITDDGWQWLPGAPLSPNPNWSVGEDYDLINIGDRIQTINASLLFDSNFEDPEFYYYYASFVFFVGDLRAVNGRIDRLGQVTNDIGEPYAPIEIITPSGRWSPDSESLPPPDQEFEIVPRINRRRLRIIIEEGEEVKRMSCDLSPLMVGIRQVLATNTSLQAQVTQANLGINANINELKPPINTINATTQTTATTVNTTATRVQNVANKLDDVGNVVNNVRTKLDDVGNVVNNVRTKLDDVGEAVNRTFNRVGEVFEEITKRLDKWARWFRLPMLLDALSFILLLHNAAMLSANVAQTVGEIINTGLQIIGLKSPDGEEFDVFDIVGKQADNFMSSILGQENWTKTKVAWKKLNNIYQAAANVIYSVQSILDSTRSIMELGAEMTGKIGNALKKAGVIFENAFNWLPEQINTATARQTKLNGMIQGIQNIDDVASSLSSAVSEVKSIQDTVIEMREQRQKFNEAVNELVTNKAETEADSKAKSQSATIQPSDLKP